MTLMCDACTGVYSQLLLCTKGSASCLRCTLCMSLHPSLMSAWLALPNLQQVRYSLHALHSFAAQVLLRV